MASVNPLNVLAIARDLYGDLGDFSTPVTDHERALAGYVKALIDNPGSLLEGLLQAKRASEAMNGDSDGTAPDPGCGGPDCPVAIRTRQRSEREEQLSKKSRANIPAPNRPTSSKSAVVLQTEAEPEEAEDHDFSEEERNADDHEDGEYQTPDVAAQEEAARKAAERAEIPKNVHGALNIEPVSLDYKRRCVAYYRSGLRRQRKKLLGIKNVQMQFTRCRSIAMLQRWDATVQLHDQRVSKLGIIRDMVLDEIRQAKEADVTEITDENIRQMALDANEQVQCDIFSASQSWIDKFKSENQEAGPENQTWSTGLPGNCDEENLIDKEDLREVEEDIAENLAVKELPLPVRQRKRRNSDDNEATSKTAEKRPGPLINESVRKNYTYAMLMKNGEQWEYRRKVVAYWRSGKRKLLSIKSVSSRFREVGQTTLWEWHKHLKEHSENWEKLKNISMFVLDKIAEAKLSGVPIITDSFIREQALEANRDVGLELFQAKKGWIKYFKVLNEDFIPNELIWPNRLPGVEERCSDTSSGENGDSLEGTSAASTDDAVSGLVTFEDVGEFVELL